jgi:hypothetical protein
MSPTTISAAPAADQATRPTTTGFQQGAHIREFACGEATNAGAKYCEAGDTLAEDGDSPSPSAP